MAKYIVRQYVAAVGGESKLESVESMYAMGEVRIGTLEFSGGEEKMKKVEMNRDMGGFVLWQKRPELWCLEMVVSGYKISAGSDGKVTWRQTPWHHSHASRGPPRPLRRLFQVDEMARSLKDVGSVGHAVQTDVDLDIREIYLLIMHFLSAGPCQKTFVQFRNELLEHQLLPRRYHAWFSRSGVPSEEDVDDSDGISLPLDYNKLTDRYKEVLDLKQERRSYESKN